MLCVCTVLLSKSINATSAPPAQSRMEIVEEYAETERYLQESALELRAFYNVTLFELREETSKILGASESNSTETEE